ncbi:MAG: saccharopine dehydrogenase family protein [Acholeplasmatales bacterium]|nr:saccharopine dehydrogenase family protein [Acholeplasmatales bacterium]
MSRVIIIGCGGVASVAIHKCCQLDDVFTDLCIASRTVFKCDKIKDDLKGKTKTNITTCQIDASDFDALCKLFKEYKPEIVMNLGMPYYNLIIMDACLECNCHYLDTAAYEPMDVDEPVWRKRYEKRVKEVGFTAYFDYSYQYEYREKFEKKGLIALLGCGFDPGVTQAYVAYAKKHEFDRIDTLDILDCNGGDHGYAFATNFNPEINLREVSSDGAYYEDGKWHSVPALSIHQKYNFDGVGEKDMYLLHHEEIESIALNLPEIKRIRFYMTFGESYIRHMKCLENVGLLRTDPIDFEGHKIIPIQFLKALLPDPASLGERTVGKTNIGCIFTGVKDGKEKKYYIYNMCDHQESYLEVNSQAVSYTTGVPAMCGALMILKGYWNTPGARTVEEYNPDPFIEALDKYGLPKTETYDPVMVD